MLKSINDLWSECQIPFICEIGLNHEGSIKKAKYLIDQISKAGGQLVKFQYRSKAGVEESLLAKEIGAEYVAQYIKRTYLNLSAYEELDNYAQSMGLKTLFSVWDCNAASEIKSLGHSVVKIGSGDLSNIHLVKKCHQLGFELILSTGLHTGEETKDILTKYKSWGINFVAMHCQSTYPAPYHHLYLGFIKELCELTGNQVGYSCHSLDSSILPLALGLGARFFEKHVTLNRDGEGNDHKASILPSELSEILNMLNRLNDTGFADKQRPLSPGEKLNQLALRKGSMAIVDIDPDTSIEECQIKPSYESGGISIFDVVMNKLGPVRRHIKSGDVIKPEHFRNKPEYKTYNFKKFGLPCRFHDADEVVQRFNPVWLEYHLSLKDLDAIQQYILPETYCCFHAPDYFEGDFFLCTRDRESTDKSLGYLRRLGNLISELRNRSGSRQNARPHVVVSIGNETEIAENLSESEVHASYRNCGEMLKRLNDEFELEFIPQTLPERAWYLGGQRRINTFACPEEVLNFSSLYKLNICFDTAHTILACNSLGKDWKLYADSLYNISRNIHLADAESIDNEGLQIGDGELTMQLIKTIVLGDKTWMPEIWQGHREEYQGFSEALDKITTMAIKE